MDGPPRGEIRNSASDEAPSGRQGKWRIAAKLRTTCVSWYASAPTESSEGVRGAFRKMWAAVHSSPLRSRLPADAHPRHDPLTVMAASYNGA